MVNMGQDAYVANIGGVLLELLDRFGRKLHVVDSLYRAAMRNRWREERNKEEGKEEEREKRNIKERNKKQNRKRMELNHPTNTIHCPLCGLDLRQNLLLANLAIAVCANENCIYPFNLSMEQIQQKRLMVKTTEKEIMAKMLPKLAGAAVDEKVAEFMVKDDLVE